MEKAVIGQVYRDSRWAAAMTRAALHDWPFDEREQAKLWHADIS